MDEVVLAPPHQDADAEVAYFHPRDFDAFGVDDGEPGLLHGAHVGSELGGVLARAGHDRGWVDEVRPVDDDVGTAPGMPPVPVLAPPVPIALDHEGTLEGRQ